MAYYYALSAQTISTNFMPLPEVTITDSSSSRSGEKQCAEKSMSVVCKTLQALPTEIGGPKGLEPTRYGDWEKNGRCIDF